MSDLTEFFSEAHELLDTFSRLLFEIEDQVRDGSEVDPDQVNEAFRSVHTLKGLAGLTDLQQLRDFSHQLENTLDSIRLGKLQLDGEVLNLLFEATNTFERLLRTASDPSQAEPVDTDSLLAKLEALLKPVAPPSTGKVKWVDDSFIEVLTEFEEHRLNENIRLGRTIYRARFEFELIKLGDGIDTVKAKLKEHGEVITFLPGTDSTDPDSITLAVLVGSKAPMATLSDAVSEEGGVVEVLSGDQPPEPKPKPEPVAPRATPTPVAPSEPEPEPSQPLDEPSEAASGTPPQPSRAQLEDEDSPQTNDGASSQTVRVDLRRLDLLMNLVGELSLIHTNLVSHGVRMRQEQAAVQLRELQTQLHTMQRRLGQLQQGILEVRMVPLQHTFDSVKRLLQRTSKELEKEVNLVVSGAATELDKKIGEKLSKPLVHMVNNAIEHGIEQPDEREAMGKPRAGRIELTAYQKGNRVVIELTDDGKGIHWQEIRDKALAKGFISREEAADIDPARAINLIFMPGFSSKSEASITGGRGVGMDVVKTRIAELSGMIDVASEPGKGSRFRVTLPSTLAIIQALVIETAGQTFCIQLNSVLESLMVQAQDIHTIEGHEVVSVRGRTLPLLYLSRVFELETAPRPRRAEERLYVVVVGLAEHRVGLVVDELLGQQDVVIKPIGKALGQVPGIGGATELGDNRTVLLLDVATLVGEAVGEAVGGAAAAGLTSVRREGISVSTSLDS